jgi:pimeloyl-ACP methyl ester carboxylesterase
LNFVREWHIVLSGFLQKAGDVNGCVKIFLELHQVIQSPHARVELRPWSCDVGDMAEMIAKLQHPDESPRICIYGYSWGGKTAENLARELHRRGLMVVEMVLCDAVYRHWYRLGQWRAFAPWSRIRIPRNVRHVTHFRQRQCYPMGHLVVAENKGWTIIEPVKMLQCDHMWMDDSPEFRHACLDAALQRQGY